VEVSVTGVRAIVGKATVQGVMALGLTGTLCYLAVIGAIQGETFLAAVVGGAFAWAFGTGKKAE
jgi:hypothetical protein